MSPSMAKKVSVRSSLMDSDERKEPWKLQPAESKESICSKATSPHPDQHLQKNSGMEPPSPQPHTNSSAPATRRLIKAMHLFMTELIKQGKDGGCFENTLVPKETAREVALLRLFQVTDSEFL